MAGAVSLLSPTVHISRSHSSYDDNTSFPWNRGIQQVNTEPTGRFRFLNKLLARRGNYGGNGRIKKQKNGSKKFNLGIEVSATNILIAINLAVWLAIQKFPMITNKFMKYDRMIARGQLYRLFTAVFVHKDFYHVAVNSYSLYSIGPQAIQKFGTARFLSTYLVSGVFANVVTYLLKSSPMSIGASGCTMGLVGAFSTYYYRNRGIFGKQQSAYGKFLLVFVYLSFLCSFYCSINYHYY